MAASTSTDSARAPKTEVGSGISEAGLSGGPAAGGGGARESGPREIGAHADPAGVDGVGARAHRYPPDTPRAGLRGADPHRVNAGGADVGDADQVGTGPAGPPAKGSGTGDAGLRVLTARRPTALLALAGLLVVSIALWCLCRGNGLPAAVLTSTVTAAVAVCLPVIRLRGWAARILRSRWHGTDDLTGLPGRRQFTATATEWLAGGHRPGGALPTALILVDLDRLRDINGTLGHEYGDHLLRVASERIRSVLRPEDLLARVDGDEFAALLRGVDLAGAEAAARRIREALQAPVHLAGLRVPAEVSVGIARSPEHGRSALELLRRAEEAMYTAKGSHSGQRVYDPDCQLGSRAGLGLRAELREALDAGQIELRYQPKADMRSGRISGVEALVRWRHPAGGLRPPDLFLPEMERAGLMGRLTRQVLDLALADCARWHAAGAALAVSVNVPPSVIVNPDFVDVVRQALERHGLSAAALVVEITEDGLITVLERAQRTLSRLRQHGVRISLDDYGTGLCSLAYLLELPADEVKLDQRFLRNIDRDASAAAIVRSTVALAHTLRLRIVAEGVETSRSWASLAAWQCDEVQGYFVSRPITADRVPAWLTEWDDRLRWMPQLTEPAVTGPIRVTAGPRATRAAYSQVASASARPGQSPAAGPQPALTEETAASPPPSSLPSKGAAPGAGARARARAPRGPQRGEAAGRLPAGPFVPGDRLTG
ncbi:putative bifunctional diguanylate cyclase/phosphodiesterase [Parafrankia elaeagni]|uniref:putative bifunctional diguanylate cyclase/phosphodiesterase n=1 Tax=Parafrankia elaeagni TaxID=222534 RepID=UPI001E4B4D98|nr:bifunctional diguanylate cyclase/phosphodiesterase [Parafrankia elaeagni]